MKIHQTTYVLILVDGQMWSSHDAFSLYFVKNAHKVFFTLVLK